MGWLELSWRNRTYRPDQATPFTIGREGDLRVLASPELHGRMLELSYADLNWWIANIGRQLDCYLYPDGAGQVHLPTRTRHPLIWPRTMITSWVAGERIDIEARVSDTPLPPASSPPVEGSTRYYKPTPRGADRSYRSLRANAAQPGRPCGRPASPESGRSGGDQPQELRPCHRCGVRKARATRLARPDRSRPAHHARTARREQAHRYRGRPDPPQPTGAVMPFNRPSWAFGNQDYRDQFGFGRGSDPFAAPDSRDGTLDPDWTAAGDEQSSATSRVAGSTELQASRKFGPLKLFLLFCSGVKLDALRRCSTEDANYVGLGGAVLSAATFATVSSSAGLAMALDRSVLSMLPFGVLWGLAIFTLRLLLAVVVSFVIAEPLLLTIFDPEIQQEIVRIKTATTAQQNRSIDAKF